MQFPSKHDWDSFFRDSDNYDETLPGERPDTVHLSNLPCKFFTAKVSDERKRERFRCTIFVDHSKVVVCVIQRMTQELFLISHQHSIEVREAKKCLRFHCNQLLRRSLWHRVVQLEWRCVSHLFIWFSCEPQHCKQTSLSQENVKSDSSKLRYFVASPFLTATSRV